MGWRRLLKWLPKLKDTLSVRHVLAKGRKSYGQTTDRGTGDTGQSLGGADPHALTPQAPALPHTLSRPHAPHCHTASLLREPRATLVQGPAFPQLLMGRLGSAGSPLCPAPPWQAPRSSRKAENCEIHSGLLLGPCRRLHPTPPHPPAALCHLTQDRWTTFR